MSKVVAAHCGLVQKANKAQAPQRRAGVAVLPAAATLMPVKAPSAHAQRRRAPASTQSCSCERPCGSTASTSSIGLVGGAGIGCDRECDRCSMSCCRNVRRTTRPVGLLACSSRHRSRVDRIEGAAANKGHQARSMRRKWADWTLVLWRPDALGCLKLKPGAGACRTRLALLRRSGPAFRELNVLPDAPSQCEAARGRCGLRVWPIGGGLPSGPNELELPWAN